MSMIARSNTFQTLCKYRLSFNPTLTENFYMDGSIKEVSLLDSMVEGAGAVGQGNFYPSNNITGKEVTHYKFLYRAYNLYFSYVGTAEAKGDGSVHTIGDDPEVCVWCVVCMCAYVCVNVSGYV